MAAAVNADQCVDEPPAAKGADVGDSAAAADAEHRFPALDESVGVWCCVASII